MRSLLSHPLILVGSLLVIGTTACVQPADSGSSTSTIAPLVLPPVTYVTAVPTTTQPLNTAPPETSPPATSPAASGSGTFSTATIVINAATTAGGSATSTTAVKVTGDQSYKVLANDTLYGIARKCSISPDALAQYNGWTDGAAHVIYPGVVVKLPCNATTDTATSTTVAGDTTTATTTIAATDAATSTTVDASTGATYTVLAGDYLAGIAAKIGTTVDAIVKANGWANSSHLIVAGQKIKVPAKK